MKEKATPPALTWFAIGHLLFHLLSSLLHHRLHLVSKKKQEEAQDVVLSLACASAAKVRAFAAKQLEQRAQIRRWRRRRIASLVAKRRGEIEEIFHVSDKKKA